MPDQHLAEHRLLGREVPVQRGAGHAHGRPDVVDGDAVEAAAREQLGGGPQDLLAPRLGRRRRRRRRGHASTPSASAATTRDGLGRPSWLGHPAAGAHQRGQVDAGLHAQAVEQPHQVLGGEVAGRAPGERAAAEAAGAGVDGRDAAAQRSQRVGERLAVRVVEVHRQPVVPTPAGRARRAARARGLPCRRRSCRPGSARRSRGPAARRPRRRPARPAPRPPTGRRSTSTGSRARAARRPWPARLTTGANASRACTRPRLRLRCENVSVALAKTATSRTPSASARSSPRSFGTSTGKRTPGCAAAGETRHDLLGVGELRAPSRAGRSWSPRPRSARRRPGGAMNAILTSVGTIAASFCRPSRGPTSQIVTRVGRPASRCTEGRVTASLRPLLQCQRVRCGPAPRPAARSVRPARPARRRRRGPWRARRAPSSSPPP